MTDSIDLDAILGKIGQMGRYQIQMYLLMSIPILVTAFSISFVFTAGNLSYRCEIPECEDGSYSPAWLPNAIPFRNGKPNTCYRYAFAKNVTTIDCSEDNFDKNLVNEKCHKFIYKDEEKTIVNDFDIHCKDNEWKLAMVGTVNNLGQFVCYPITGYLSDTNGRKWTLIYGLIGSGVMGIIRSFSVNYIMFLVFEFLDLAFGAGIYSCAFVLALEFVGPKRRVLFSLLLSCTYGSGEIIMGVIAMYVRNWRTFLRVLYIPMLMCAGYAWIVPESIRWLLSKGRKEKATEIILRVAKVNRKLISPESLDELLHKNENEKEKVEENVKESEYHPSNIMKSPYLLIRVMICSFCWMTNTLVYYGLQLNAVAVAGNKYVDFIAIASAEIPGFIISAILMDKIGRKKTLFGMFMVSGVACVLSQVIPSEYKLGLFFVGKLAITGSFSTIYVYTTEIFPTNLRHTLFATCSMFGRIGSMIAPQTVQLIHFWTPLPFVVFAVFSTTAAFLALQFPETLNKKLPQNINEAKEIELS